MIDDEYREWFEQMFIGFTNAVFGGADVPAMYMIIIGKDAEVIPLAPESIPRTVVARLIAKYANVRNAQFIAHISWAIRLPMGTEVPDDPVNHPDAEEVLTLVIGDPRGELHAITGLVKRATDNTPYVEEWNWSESVEANQSFILPFTD